MVRPLTSKRKLFNNNKDQFKENEPDQLNSTESESYSARTTLSSGLYSNHKSLNASKKGLAESSSCEGKKESGLGSIGIDWHRRCSFEDGGNVLTPGRTAMPMSERQQIALVMQLSSPSPTNKSDLNSLGSPQTPTPPHFGRGLAKRNERGETPLHVAAIKGDRDKVSQLIAQGANVNATDYAGHVPAELVHIDENGWTALHEACNRGFLVIASLLIRGGAEVNAKGLDDDTPLHDACVNNHFQIVRLLLNSGARTDAINCRGKTPFDVCRSAGILSLLEEAKAGKLQDLGTPEKDFNKRRIQEVSLIERDFCATNNNESYHNNNNSPDDYSPHIHNKDSFGMSRKTPPSSKMEEKPTIPTSTSSSTPTSTAGGLSTNGNGVSSGANGRPVSPRVTLRLPHVPRTPDKSQQRSHDSKSTPEGEDVYEFRCSKEESKEGENEEKSDSGSKQQDSSPSDVKGDKRPRENDPDEDDELKKKRRKEEGKEGMKNTGRGTGGRPSSSEKGMKVGQRTTPANGSNNNKPSSTPTSTNVTSSTVTSLSNTVTSTSNSSTVSSSTNSEQRKSPPGSAVSSPRPPSGGSKASAEKSDSDNEEVKNESTAAGAPKVPPLKIVLAPCGLSEQETSSLNGKNGSNRQLPYVVNSSSSSAEEKDNPSVDSGKESVVVKEELCTTVSSSCGNTSTITSIGTSSNTTAILNSSGNLGNSAVNVSNVSSSVITTTTLTTDKSSAARITRSQRGGGGGGGGSSSSNEDQVQVKPELKSDDPLSTDVVHPRKRKIKMKEPEAEQIPPSSVPEQPVTNCYEMFLKIRKQVERRRKLLFPVQPKPPQGFKDYLMNRCSYVLANSSNSQLSVPIIPPPTSLTHQALKDLFTEQEQERYKLRLQQLIEKEKLVLSVEQEILRVHGRAARALANQVLPFSVCTILKDEEVYNVISPEQEEKDRNARSRYNGRLFLSWLQDVDDKWEKIKEAMVLRHHNEAESLHAVQKMDWEWKLKELGLAEPNTKVQIDELHVPMVQVADFDLLPV